MNKDQTEKSYIKGCHSIDRKIYAEAQSKAKAKGHSMSGLIAALLKKWTESN